MIRQTVFSPFFGQNIEVEAEDMKDLKEFIEVAERMIAEETSEEMRRSLLAVKDIYLQALDQQRREEE